MNSAREPRTEELANAISPVKKHYDDLNRSLGVGDNPLFANAPNDAVMHNLVGDEKPIFYPEPGKILKWLTNQDIEKIKSAHPENIMDDEQQFDLFSFMVGSMSPSIRDLGLKNW